jgi:hypothetical protein
MTNLYILTAANGADLRGKYCENMDYVIPAQAGIQSFQRLLDTCFRRYDKIC